MSELCFHFTGSFFSARPSSVKVYFPNMKSSCQLSLGKVLWQWFKCQKRMKEVPGLEQTMTKERIAKTCVIIPQQSVAKRWTCDKIIKPDQSWMVLGNMSVIYHALCLHYIQDQQQQAALTAYSWMVHTGFRAAVSSFLSYIYLHLVISQAYN